MVGSENIWSDRRRNEPIFQYLGNEKIINAPPYILRSRSREVTPPGVGIFFFRIEMPKSIDKTSIEKRLKSFSFFFGISRVMLICFRVSEIDRSVCDIEITAKYYRSIHLKASNIIEKKRIPELTIVEAFEFSL